MKKIFALVLAVMMLAALAMSASALPTERTDVTVYKNTPTLDGTINLGEWDIDNAIKMTTDNSAAWAGEVSNLVTFYYSWDDNGFYAAAQVSDTDVCQPDDIAGVYGKDAFQVAFDPHGLLADGGETGGMFFSIGLLSDGTLGAVYHPYGQGAGEEFDYTGAGRLTDDGWEFEMMIPWTSIEVISADGYEWHHGDGEFVNAIICMLDRDEDGAVTNAYKTAIEGAEASFSPADYALKLNLSTYVAPSLETPADETPADETPVEDTTPADTTPAETTAPVTADAGIVVAAVVMAAAAAVVVAKKH